MRSRGWSIRAKIMTLAVVPLFAIAGLGVFGVAVTAGPALNLRDITRYEHAVTDLGERLMQQLQHERRISGQTEPGTGNAGAPVLAEQRIRTDDAYRSFRARFVSSGAREFLPAGHLRVVDAFVADMDGLVQLRVDFDAADLDAVAVVRRYSELIDSAYRMFAPLTEVSHARLSRVAHSLFAMSRSRELLAREDSVITAAIADRRIDAADHSRILQAIGARRFLQAEGRAMLTSPYREAYEPVFASEEYITLEVMEDSLGAARPGGPLPIDPEVWRASADAVITHMSVVETDTVTVALAEAEAIGVTTFLRPIVAGLIGLLCAALALMLALRTGRSVVRRLERLRAAALEVAHERLPSAIAALRKPGATLGDLSLSEMPRIAVGADEVGQVGHAFAAVQRTAVRAAVDEATLRRGLSEVFLNIARRSQALLHRQLTLLDRMERRTTNPQELEDLFRLDHMATRMRRHAEALVILAGSAPGRGWRHPVPLIDVVRGATSEIEEYVRVSTDRLPEVRIAGRAVGDLIHLIAELLENAASFAPPHTRVRVFAEAAYNGLALQIEDRGLGMSDTELAEANERLSAPPGFDPASIARLGLLVVAKLAERQGITVRLQPSTYGGITAVVLIPHELVLPGSADLPSNADRAAGRIVQRNDPATLSSRAPRELPAAPALSPSPLPSREPAVEEQTAALSADDGPGGLPKRVRRQAEPVAPAAEPEPDTVRLPSQPGTRTAEEIRSRMAAFQTGTVRGRAQAVSSPESRPAEHDENLEGSA